MSNDTLSTLSAAASVLFAAGGLACLAGHLLQVERKRRTDLQDMQERLLEHAKSRPDFSMEGAVCSLYGCVLIAVDQEAERLLVACVSEDTVTGKLWGTSEILSAEVATNVHGDARPLGGVLSERPSGRQPICDLSGAWLKLLVKDISSPWVLIPMSSIAEADRWKGIVSLLTRRAAA